MHKLDAQLIGHFDLIKIDVEGMALEVLAGAGALIEQSGHPPLFVEIEDRDRAKFETG